MSDFQLGEFGGGGGEFYCQGIFDNIWRYFWLSYLEVGANYPFPWVEARDLAKY